MERRFVRPIAGASIWLFAGFGLERLLLESWPWWAHFGVAGGLAGVWFAVEAMQARSAARTGGVRWLTSTDAEKIVMGSKLFRRRLGKVQPTEGELLGISPHRIASQQASAINRLADRYRPEVARQILIEFRAENATGYDATVDLYEEKGLRDWLVSRSEPRPPLPLPSFMKPAPPLFPLADEEDG